MKQIALDYLANLEKNIQTPLSLIESETINQSFFTVFFYNSREYLESGDPSTMLMGNAPFIINKNDGSIHITGTDQPIDFYIDKYNMEHSHKTKNYRSN